MNRLTGRTAIVTGAARGIGAAYARLGQDMASFVEERALRLLARPAEVARDDAPRRRAETP